MHKNISYTEECLFFQINLYAVIGKKIKCIKVLLTSWPCGNLIFLIKKELSYSKRLGMADKKETIFHLD